MVFGDMGSGEGEERLVPEGSVEDGAGDGGVADFDGAEEARDKRADFGKAEHARPQVPS